MSKTKPLALVVEDELLLRKALCEELAQLGLSVDEADEGVMALRKLTLKSYDIILLDIIMPGMDGITFLKRIRASEKWKNVPVIILTNLTSDTIEIDEAKQLGVVKVFVKAEVSLAEVAKFAVKTAKGK